MNNPSDSKAAVLLRLLVWAAAFSLLSILAIYAADQYATDPGWWSARNVIQSGTGNANNYAAANAGQLKNIATAAFNELSANLPGGVGDMTAPSGTFPGGTGWQLTALINGWHATLSGSGATNANDYAAVNLGQLKTVASLFYNRLIEVGYTNQYPWLSSTNAPNDYAAANIGQVKNLFSFDVAYSSSGSGGIPDWWETEYFGSGTNGWMSGTAAAPSGNGLTIAQSYATGVSPIDYYNGISPTLAIVSGTNQTSASGTFLPAPLVVQVTGTSSQPMVNAPVTFVVTQGAGVLAPDNSGTSPASGSLQVRTGTDGKAQVCFQQPLDASFTSTVAATAETSEVDFSATTLSDTNAPAAPSNVSAIVQPDGSVQVTWKDNSDNETGFTIQISNDGGNTWTTVGTTGADATSYLVAAGQAVTPGATQINVTATGTGQNSAPSTSGTPTAPLPTINYAVVDISGTYTNVTFNDTDVTFDYSSYSYQNNPSTTANMNMNVLSMALGDDNNAAYCFVNGDYFGMDQFGGYFGGNNQVTVNKWSGGVTSPSALTIACNQPGQNITTGTGASSLSGWRDESLNTDGGLYQSVLWQWIESPYILNYNNYPPSVQLTPQGNAWGTVFESCGFPFDTFPRADAIVIGNVFYRSSGTQQMQINEFTGSSFTTGTTNLVVNNTTHYGNGASLYEPQNGGVPSGPPLGTMLLASSQAGYCGVGMFGMANTNAPGIYSRDDCFTASYISLSGSTPTGTALSGTTIFYDPNQGNNSSLTGRLSQLPSGITKIATPFTPAAMNDYGHAIGGSYYWNGTALVSLGTNSTAAGLNNQNMVIGGSTTGGTTTGMLWLENSGTSPMTMQSLVPQTSGSEVTGIIPYAISGTNSSNRVSILCSGWVLETSGTTTGWMNETLLFQVDATTPSGNVPSGTTPGPVMSIVKMPASINWYPNYTPAYQKINSNGIISGIGAITTGTTPSAQKALLLLPVQFKQVYPCSGFDWVSQPQHWLMVPAGGGSNQTIAITPATSSLTINFSEQSGTSTTSGTVPLTISPVTTNTSPQTLTISSSGTNTGDNNEIAVGVGTTSGTGGMLGIDVKPMTTGTIAIHAVTQHYTKPMVLLPGMTGTPGTVCVQGTHVLNTSPVSPDNWGPAGSLTIVTGPDGICHTAAAAGDTPVIPVGQAIPADIVPANVPAAADLQTYLNQVFGTQANLYFTVTRDDITCNYDVMTPINGILDLWEGQGAPPSAEQAVIEGQGTSGVTANIFYVKDYQGLPLSGTTPDHSSIGITNYTRHLAYVRDCGSYELQTSAHELGHILNLDHSIERDGSYRPSLPSGASNPVVPVDRIDPAQRDRLMNWVSSGSNTRLVQPEWDIINPNNPSKP